LRADAAEEEVFVENKGVNPSGIDQVPGG